ncbi:MAG: uncharacterized protein KVP18_003413, partial [Porospora cf. gigantea A]|uniref:uncharacterized protein n=2 Tax=Porospora cf. gigantea A TaxID=2853593 RepID=UPI003559D1BD
MRVVAPTFPVYRLSICLCLMTWGAGTCLRVYEHYGVNYKFMLDVDPKCTVDSGCLLFIASVQTGVVLVSLLCFLADYKFCLLGSTHFIHAYCIGNLAIQILILCWPSQVVRREYRRSTLRMVLEVFKSAFVTPTAVSFPDALVGDVLTSIVKPLADLFTTVCYATELAVWGTAGTLGTRWFDVVSPILAAMPLIVRIQQNYSSQHWQVLRFSFGNFFKQRAVALHQHVGLLVPTHLGSYVFATLYTLFWDFTMDWQLMPDPNSFLRASDKVMFPQWLYSLIGVMNVSGRLTWAMTLMPIHILSSELLMSTVLALIVSAVEIVRRCGWCILKLETEHLTNSSRYRAMLWVPKLNTREAKQVRDVVADRAAEEETWEKLARTAEAESAVPSKDASKNTVATILALARLKSRRPESKGTS